MPRMNPLGSLEDLFPQGVIEIGRDHGQPQTLPAGNPGTLSAPIAPATPQERAEVSPTPEGAAASVMSAASQGGRRDSFGDMLLKAGQQNAGPLAGLSRCPPLGPLCNPTSL